MKRQARTERIVGGVNLVDAKSLLPPGALVGGNNMEVMQGGGVRRCDGYERIDGVSSHQASLATYSRFTFNLGANATFADGDTVLGGTSGATGLVCGPGIVTSGSVVDGNAAGELYLFVLTGVFVSGEVLTVGGSYRATLTSTAFSGTVGDAGRKDALRRARNYVRSLCTAPTGSGGILGVVNHGGTVYCVRNNAGGTAAVMYKSSGSGWQAITLYREVAFTAGSGSVADGQTVTETAGGEAATIKRVVVTSGSLSDGNAAGRLIVTTPSGSEFDGGAATTSGGGSLTLSGASTAITLAPNGRFEFLSFNFYGASGSRRIYGVDGQNRGFEFNPSDDVLVPITTGMAVDKPTHVAAHMGRLWFTFPGGSLQWSSVVSPFIWSAIVGSGELGLGDEATAIKSLKQDAFAVFGRNSAFVLYGSSFIESNFVKLLETTGCVPYTLDEVAGATISVDNVGVYFLEAAQQFGDFKPNSLSRTVEPLTRTRASSAVAAMTVRSKSQYRVYFADMTGITATFSGTKLAGWFPFTLAHQVTCVWAGEDASGDEVLYAGLSSGYVVMLDSGTSYDGEAVDALASLAPTALGDATMYKQFFAAIPQVNTPQAIALDLLMEFDFGGLPGDVYDGEGLTPPTGGIWGQGTWGQFFWGSPLVATPTFDIDGLAQHVQCIYRHTDDVDEPWSLEANTIEFAYLGRAT